MSARNFMSNMLVATRSCMPNNDFQSTAGNPICMNTRTRHKSHMLQTIADLELVYSNWVAKLVTGTVVEESNSNAITIRAAIEYPVGTYNPIYFNGTRDVTLSATSNSNKPAGINVISDPCAIQIPPNTFFYIRTLVSVASAGQSWPTGETCVSANGEGANTATTYTDNTLSGTITTNANNGFFPSAILGTMNNSVPAILIVGDSIADGTGDNTGGDADGNLGYPARALTNNFGWTKITRSSDQAQNFIGNNAPWNYSGRLSAVRDAANAAIVEMGINDITAGEATATVQANLTALWELLTAKGLNVFQCTITPLTTSSDSWKTTANQTVTVYEAVRVAVNNWIRTAPSPLSGYFETADQFETSRNSGLWRVNGTANYWTIDGTHPSAAAHAAAATAINTNQFWLAVTR